MIWTDWISEDDIQRALWGFRDAVLGSGGFSCGVSRQKGVKFYHGNLTVGAIERG